MSAIRIKKPATNKKVSRVAKNEPKKERKFSTISKTMFVKPRLSEKTYELSEKLNVYTFEVPEGATKHTVADAIAAQYGNVTIKQVRISRIPGKTQRSYRRGGRNVRTGQRSDIRKAYVTLAEGDKLPIYAAVEENKGAKNA